MHVRPEKTKRENEEEPSCGDKEKKKDGRYKSSKTSAAESNPANKRAGDASNGSSSTCAV